MLIAELNSSWGKEMNNTLGTLWGLETTQHFVQEATAMTRFLPTASREWLSSVSGVNRGGVDFLSK